MAKRKGTNNDVQNTTYRKLQIEQDEPPLKIWGEPRCSGIVRSSCTTCGTRRITLGVNLGALE